MDFSRQIYPASRETYFCYGEASSVVNETEIYRGTFIHNRLHGRIISLSHKIREVLDVTKLI